MDSLFLQETDANDAVEDLELDAQDFVLQQQSMSIDEIVAVIEATKQLDSIFPKGVKHGLIEWVMGRKRWEVEASWFVYEDHYAMAAQIIKDIYPLVGPKHKKLPIKVYCLDRNGGVQERDFVSKEGKHWNELKNDVYPRTQAWITLTSGKPITKQWE